MGKNQFKENEMGDLRRQAKYTLEYKMEAGTVGQRFATRRQAMDELIDVRQPPPSAFDVGLLQSDAV